METMTSREFNQDTARAKRAAEKGPVFITNRGKRAYVLLSNAEYERITGAPRSLLDALAMPGMEDIDFEPPRMEGFYSRPADLGD